MSQTSVQKPEALEWGQGKIFPTLNAHGFVLERMDPYSKLFVKSASRAPGKTNLEIGASFGYATKQVLLHNSTIIANDISKEHLDIIEETTPALYKKGLTTLQGDFATVAGQCDKLKPGCLANVLISRTLQHMTPDKVEQTLKTVFDLLMPGGKLYVVSDTPFLRVFEGFLPTFEQRVAAGDPNPGIINDVTPARAYFGEHPNYLNLMNDETLIRLTKAAGYTIEKSGYFECEEYPDELRLDGREGVGIVARK